MTISFDSRLNSAIAIKRSCTLPIQVMMYRLNRYRKLQPNVAAQIEQIFSSCVVLYFHKFWTTSEQNLKKISVHLDRKFWKNVRTCPTILLILFWKISSTRFLARLLPVPSNAFAPILSNICYIHGYRRFESNENDWFPNSINYLHWACSSLWRLVLVFVQNKNWKLRFPQAVAFFWCNYVLINTK